MLLFARAKADLASPSTRHILSITTPFGRTLILLTLAMNIRLQPHFNVTSRPPTPGSHLQNEAWKSHLNIDDTLPSTPGTPSHNMQS